MYLYVERDKMSEYLCKSCSKTTIGINPIVKGRFLKVFSAIRFSIKILRLVDRNEKGVEKDIRNFKKQKKKMNVQKLCLNGQVL